MRIFFFIISFIASYSLFGQQDIIELAVLPSEYAEGMPLKEFIEFEKNVIKYLDKVERFKILKRPQEYIDADWKWDFDAQTEQIKAEGQKIKAPYFLQIVFGDTEWAASQVQTGGSIRIQNGRSSNISGPSVETKNATLWITFNLYNVSSGTLENTLTVNAKSNEYPKYRSSPAIERTSFKNAVSAGQKSLWKKVKTKIYRLFPANFSIQKIETLDKKSAESILINAGKFQGLEINDRLYVYYEKEYIVRGKPTFRHVQAGKLIVTNIDKSTSICQVKKGKKSIPDLLKEGKILKCKIIDYSEANAHYGF